MLDSNGGFMLATEVVVETGAGPNGWDQPGVVVAHCRATQSFRPARRTVWDFANTGQVFGFEYPCGTRYLSTNWQGVISASGQAEFTGVVVLGQSQVVDVGCPCIGC